MNPPKGVLEAAIEGSGTALFAVAPDGEILWHAGRFASDWEVPPEVLERGKLSHLLDFLRARGSEGDLTLAALLGSEHPPQGGEIMASSGRPFTYRWVDVDGDRGRAWTFLDASERRHLTAALRDAGDLLQVIEAHLDGVILEVDADACVVAKWSTNDALCDEDDAPIQGRSFVDLVGGSAGEKVDALVRGVLATGEASTVEYALELGGTRRVFAADARLMPSSKDDAPRVTVMFREVTERARMQMQLLQSERLASFGLLAAGVAHEINNPLAYLLLNLERIQKGLQQLAAGAPGDLVTELLDGIALGLEGGRRVQAIVSDLRRFSRADAGEANLPIDVRRVLDFAIEMAGHEVHKRARVVRELGDVPLVRASESRLIQVFLNLLVNAAQAIADGAPDDNEIRVVTKTDESGRAVIEIHDTGEGMTSAVLQHAFEPFYTTKPAGMGTGLGLAICRDIATSLGGEVAVESERGRGTVFRVLLPAA